MELATGRQGERTETRAGRDTRLPPRSPVRPATAPPIEVLEVGSLRPDLASRREFKCTLSSERVDAVRQLLEANGQRQVFHRRVSHVRSLYFDDAAFSACRANLQGLGQRRKLRLRWYDRTLPGREAFLEIKWRDNRTTGKHRLCLRTSESFWTLPFPAMWAELAAAVPAAYLPILLQYSEPTLLVQYCREHFVALERPLRVTLDYHIRYFDQTGKRSISTSFGQLHEGLAVLEGKLPPGCERELRSFLQPLTPRFGRCSKYVHGCQLVGLVRQG